MSQRRININYKSSDERGVIGGESAAGSEKLHLSRRGRAHETAEGFNLPRGRSGVALSSA